MSSVRFDVGSSAPKHDPPASMEPYDLSKSGDLGALSNEQQAEINKLKVETRVNNERYLRDHPEIKFMITAFMKDLLIKQPENTREYFADFFTSSDLETKIEQIKGQYNDQYRDECFLRALAAENINDQS